MSKIRETAFALFLVVGAFGLVLHCSGGCAPTPEAKALAADEAYKLEQLRCVAQNETNAEIDACRERVRARWHTSRDAGGDQ